ncbi:hypothetical protein FGG08_000167 [Glutinoglossum americanum]|uniref:Nucleoside phosphorylase domain-containing protein n=1 Tax=Glutinoglossum americanum TaxID=1670608 RepID=A0A9P8I9S1_9PEZI|nr:hypothetical protein FGG08_000167 [Glutinoglossum americanum]
MTDYPPPTRREDFEIAVICALRIEGDAVEALFDKIWRDEDYTLQKEQTDRNTYTLGLIGRHNVVLTWMPGIGKASAAVAATDLRNSFRRINLTLVVGICGGVPKISDGEILLGDVIVSTGINQYDFGRRLPGTFLSKDTTGRAAGGMASFLNKVQGIQGHRRLAENTFIYLNELLKKKGFQIAQYPGANEDKLYKATYRHKHHNLSSCDNRMCGKSEDEVCDNALDSSCIELKCDEKELLPRDRQARGAAGEPPIPAIYFGLVASGDTVMKSGEHRDKIAVAQNVIAFEMEGAGVRDTLPCVFVIKGVCDYADSHKNKKWQRYAASTGAACMKAFLEEWTSPGKLPQGRPSQARAIAKARLNIRLTRRNSVIAVQPDDSLPKISPTSPSDNTLKSAELFVKEIPSPIRAQTNSPNSLELLRACQERNIDRIEELLEKPDTSLNARGDKGRGVLHFALGADKVNTNISEMKKATDIVRLLFIHRVDVNAPDESGLRPIHYCAKTINFEATMFLLDKGARINEPDKKGRTALHYVAIDSKPDVQFAEMLIGRGGELGSVRLPDLVPRATTSQRHVRRLIKPLERGVGC